MKRLVPSAMSTSIMASAESKKAEAKKQKESKHRTGSVCETVSYITLDSIPCFSNVFCIANPA